MTTQQDTRPMHDLPEAGEGGERDVHRVYAKATGGMSMPFHDRSYVGHHRAAAVDATERSIAAALERHGPGPVAFFAALEGVARDA